MEIPRDKKNIPLADRKGWKLLIRGPWRAEQGGGGENYLSKINNAIQDCGSQIEIQEPTFSSVELKNELEKGDLITSLIELATKDKSLLYQLLSKYSYLNQEQTQAFYTNQIK